MGTFVCAVVLLGQLPLKIIHSSPLARWWSFPFRKVDILPHRMQIWETRGSNSKLTFLLKAWHEKWLSGSSAIRKTPLSLVTYQLLTETSYWKKPHMSRRRTQLYIAGEEQINHIPGIFLKFYLAKVRGYPAAVWEQWRHAALCTGPGCRAEPEQWHGLMSFQLQKEWESEVKNQNVTPYIECLSSKQDLRLP